MIVGIVGLGSIAQKHIAALREIDPLVQIIALRHSVLSSPVDGIQSVFDYNELLSYDLDFIIISNPTSEHLKTIEILADSDVPLFIEKPIFNTLYEYPKLKQKSYVACNLRFLEALVYVKNNIKDRRINEVNAYCGSYLPEWRSNGDWRKCYSANKSMGGGVHIDLIHELDYIYWLFGKPQSIVKSLRNVSSLNIDAFDYANYMLGYEQFSTSIVLNYYRRDYKRTLEIVLDDDTWFVDLAKNQVLNHRGEVLFSSKRGMLDTYKSQIQVFIENLNSDYIFNDINEAYEVLKICLEDEIR